MVKCMTSRPPDRVDAISDVNNVVAMESGFRGASIPSFKGAGLDQAKAVNQDSLDS